MNYQQNFSYREETEINRSVNSYDEPRGGNASADNIDRRESSINSNQDEWDRQALTNIAQDIKTLQGNIVDIMKNDPKWKCPGIIAIILILIYISPFVILSKFYDTAKNLIESKFEYILAYAIVHTIIIAFLINRIYWYKKKSADQMIRILKTMIYREKYLNKYH